MLTIKNADWTKDQKRQPAINPMAPGSTTPNAINKRQKSIDNVLGNDIPKPQQTGGWLNQGPAPTQYQGPNPQLQSEFNQAYKAAISALSGFGNKFMKDVGSPYNAAYKQIKELLQAKYQEAQAGNVPDNQFVKGVNQLTQTLIKATQALQNDTTFVSQLTQQILSLSQYMGQPQGSRGPMPQSQPQQGGWFNNLMSRFTGK